MIATLDQIDGDPDLEPTNGDVNKHDLDEIEGDHHGDDPDREPSLGWTATFNQSARAWQGHPQRGGRRGGRA
jgi:hypothetical protein